jgi:hypothetical protein
VSIRPKTSTAPRAVTREAPADPAGYTGLLELARMEQELAESGRYDELGALAERWDTLVGSLPEPRPEDRETIEQIELIVWSTVTKVHKAMRDVAGTMTLINRGRRAIATYAGQAPAQLVAVDARI